MESPSGHVTPDAGADAARPPASQALGLSPHRRDDAMDRLIVMLARLSAAPIAAFCVDEHDRHFMASAYGLHERALLQRSPLVETATRQDQVLMVADAAQDPRYAADPLVTGGGRIRSFAALPVRGPDRNRLGALCVMDWVPDSFDDHARAALHEVRALLEDRLRLRADALHDPLTGTLSRRHFDEIADREWRRAMRALAPISVIVCELDHVHEFAAREGLQAFDRGLRATGLAVQYTLHRPGDCVCRYDETRFVALLPGTDEPGAAETAERVRKAVEALVIPFADAPTSLLTLSLGVATIPSEALSRGDLHTAVNAATAALHNAQRAGGNRWTLAGADGEFLFPS